MDIQCMIAGSILHEALHMGATLANTIPSVGVSSFLVLSVFVTSVRMYISPPQTATFLREGYRGITQVRIQLARNSIRI